MKAIHQGRGGYIEIAHQRYQIEHIEAGRFCIHFPSGNRARLTQHLVALTEFAKAQNPEWQVENHRHLAAP